MTNKRLKTIFADIDELNSRDPHTSTIDGCELANELLYGQRMSTTLNEFNPEASEVLQIAVRAQHIERWTLPRTDFPEGRSGYKKWRSQLALHHANRTAELMQKHAYSNDDIERAKYLLLKRGLKHDEETQCLEDVACIVFLTWYFADFAAKHSEAKLIHILQLSWGKMSEKGHAAALKLTLTPGLQALVQKALS